MKKTGGRRGGKGGKDSTKGRSFSLFPLRCQPRCSNRSRPRRTGAVLREPGLGRSLSLTLFSWTETHKDATEGSQRRKTGQKCLLSTTLDQPPKTAMEHARRVLGDELINNRTPRCLQTSVFSKVVAEIHKLFPQCQIPTGTPVSDPGRGLGDQPTHPLCFWLELR